MHLEKIMENRNLHKRPLRRQTAWELSSNRRTRPDRIPAGPVFAVLLFCCLVFLSGCGSSTDDNSVRVFYLTPDRTALSSILHEPEAESEYGQAEELLDLLSESPMEEGFIAPVSGFSLKDFSIEKSTILLEFSGEYRDMDAITEKLTRAAIVNTLCGLENIRRVTIRVNGALIVDEHGNKSENMTSDQFIYNSGSEMLNFERTQMHLYFAAEDGKKLVETYRTVVFNGNIPMEKLVVEQTIAGPNGDFSFPTVNENTKIVNIVTRDDLCTVTFDRTFLTNPNPVDPEVALYSIVNSLTELPSIRQVQILIDGVEKPVFMDTYVLDSETLLQKNTKIVQAREQ